MIILRVMGGLGNQMFQMAYALVHSLETGEDVYLDIDGFNNYKIRKYKLEDLVIGSKIKYLNSDTLNLNQKIIYTITRKMYHIFQYIVRRINKNRIGQKVFHMLNKFGLIYNFDPYYYDFRTSNSKIKHIYGYFQSEEYFKKYKTHIVEALQVITPISEGEHTLLKKISEVNSCAVSIRIGEDYTSSDILNVCNENYFMKSMKEIKDAEKDIVFFIFSDSIHKVKELFCFDSNVIYVEGFSETSSLRLMYHCNHFIISNSSFSWWGAYLGTTKNKRIISPSVWYNMQMDKPDIYTNEMVEINVDCCGTNI